MTRTGSLNSERILPTRPHLGKRLCFVQGCKIGANATTAIYRPRQKRCPILDFQAGYKTRRSNLGIITPNAINDLFTSIHF